MCALALASPTRLSHAPPRPCGQSVEVADVKAAVECFVNIMAFMGDFPVKNSNETLHVQVRGRAGLARRFACWAMQDAQPVARAGVWAGRARARGRAWRGGRRWLVVPGRVSKHKKQAAEEARKRRAKVPLGVPPCPHWRRR